MVWYQGFPDGSDGKESESESLSCSVSQSLCKSMDHSPLLCRCFFCSPLQALLCQWDFLHRITGAVCHFFFQGIFLTQGLNPGLLYYRQILYPVSYRESFCQYLICFLHFILHLPFVFRELYIFQVLSRTHLYIFIYEYVLYIITLLCIMLYSLCYYIIHE